MRVGYKIMVNRRIIGYFWHRRAEPSFRVVIRDCVRCIRRLRCKPATETTTRYVRLTPQRVRELDLLGLSPGTATEGNPCD